MVLFNARFAQLSTRSYKAVLVCFVFVITLFTFQAKALAVKPVLTVDAKALTPDQTITTSGVPFTVRCSSSCSVKVSGGVLAQRGIESTSARAYDQYITSRGGSESDNLGLSSDDVDRLHNVGNCPPPYFFSSYLFDSRVGCSDPYRNVWLETGDGVFTYVLWADAYWLDNPASRTWSHETISLTGCNKASGTPGKLKVPEDFCRVAPPTP